MAKEKQLSINKKMLSNENKSTTTINQLLLDLNYGGDEVVLVKRLKDNPLNKTVHTAKELLGDKRKVAFARLHQGGIKYSYNALLIVTER